MTEPSVGMGVQHARIQVVPAPVALAPRATPPRDLAAVAEVLRSGWLTLGPRTFELEAACARRAGVPHAVACAGATAALHLALLALGVGPGDAVVVPGLGGAAAAAAAARCGAGVVVAGVGGATDPTIDPRDVLRRAGANVKAVVVVHLAGLRARADELVAACAQRGIAVVELAPGGMTGTVEGAVACCGLLPAGPDGGEAAAVLLTRDDAVAAGARSRRSHAMTSGTWARHTGAADTYDVVGLGFNYRVDELRSVLALGALQRADGELSIRRALARAYREGLAGCGVVCPDRDGELHAFPVVLGDETARDAVRGALAAAGIATGVVDAPGGAPAEAASLAARLVLLPLHAEMGMEDVARTCLAVAGR